ncbi:hypothetical protein [Ciceribacter sp. L1K22]|uniref:hypothetical protein n=1 Tax=Ciceribacter sp. L1K22 TaxID=2820275 RepID=UPI001ABE64B3|nr:hypothetical protein [Ciceribacter sp. L1K22]MBO3759868.1 hypothetical protein [Ciceribacter sp. L1K22]
MHLRFYSLPILVAISTALTMTGCTATGSGDSRVTDRIGRPMGSARVTYETSGGATARMTVALPDGEIYTGSALSVSRNSEPHAGFLVGSGKVRSSLLIDAGTREWEGTIEAVLAGSAGRTMTCRLREKKTGLGFEGGVLGTCTVSDGRVVAIDM